MTAEAISLHIFVSLFANLQRSRLTFIRNISVISIKRLEAQTQENKEDLFEKRIEK